MDRTPLEIWTKILGHACTDSGVTGRQLSLVSKFIREASAAVKLQSISIHGRQQMIAFYQLLLQTPPHLRHIRYLFLSTTPRPPTRDLAHFAPPPMAPKREESPADSEDAEKLRTACQGVLTAVAERVEILYLDVRAEYLRWHLPCTSFPQLAELASNGPPKPPVSYTIPAPNTTPCGPCPKLRRWHLIGLDLMWRGEGAFATIRATAPALTHVCFSGLREYSGFVSDMKAGLPETIQHFYVQPAGMPRGWCGNARASYRNFMDGLKTLNLADSRLVLLPAYKVDETVGIRLMGEWEERINGGDGRWSVRERVVAKINRGQIAALKSAISSDSSSVRLEMSQ